MVWGLPSKQTVNGVDGGLQARDVRVGCRLWTLDGERTVQTTVTDVGSAKVREVVDVVTDHVTFTVASDQLLGGGDAHHLRQRFPRVVLHDRETFEGFLDGYTDIASRRG